MPKTGNKPDTEKAEKYRQHRQAGMTCRAIASLYGITTQAVYGFCASHGIQISTRKRKMKGARHA